jgi:hypothetical protein
MEATVREVNQRQSREMFGVLDQKDFTRALRTFADEVRAVDEISRG